EFGGQVVPGDAGLEHEQNASKNLAVVQGLAAGEAKTARRGRRQQRLDVLPEFVGHQESHGRSSLGVGERSPTYQGAASVPIVSFFPNALNEAVHFFSFCASCRYFRNASRL